MSLKIKETVFQQGRPQVAVSLTGKNMEEILLQCQEAVWQPVQVLEWRVDYYLNAMDDLNERLTQADIYLEMMDILDGIHRLAPAMPLIFTIRTRGQGGQVSLGNEQISGLQIFAAESGMVDLVDVEIKGLKKQFGGIGGQLLVDRVAAIHGAGAGVILSYHDFEEMIPAKNLAMLVAAMKNYQGDLLKVAAMARSEEDAEEMIRATAFLTGKGIGPLVTMAMGKDGITTRIIGGKYGSVMTFAAVGETSAPGQISAARMKRELDRFYGA